MKNLCPTLAALALLLGSSAASADDSAAKPAAEPAKVKVATINIQRIVNGGNFFDKIRILSLDKNTLEALKKINAEIQELSKQVIDADDAATLNDLQQKLQFLTQKRDMLQQRARNTNTNMDIMSAVRKFAVSQFKDKYALILEEREMGMNYQRVLWKGDVEVVDISDDVQEQFHEYLDKLAAGAASSIPGLLLTPNGAGIPAGNLRRAIAIPAVTRPATVPGPATTTKAAKSRHSPTVPQTAPVKPSDPVEKSNTKLR
jgi:hypothetical protein